VSVTSEVNRAKDDLDVALGELQRLYWLLGKPEVSDPLGSALDIARFNVKKVRASL
jgi:hypothetical protein